MNKIVIPHVLMDQNTFISRQRGNKFGGARAKKEQSQLCALYIKQAMNKGLTVKHYPIDITFNWIMPNRMKDKDNICFAKKFILDAMQLAGLIRNDGWNEIGDFTDQFFVDRKFPRVEIEIKELESESV